MLASTASAYDRYVIRKSKNLSLVGCFLLSQLQEAAFVTFPRRRLLNIYHLVRPYARSRIVFKAAQTMIPDVVRESTLCAKFQCCVCRKARLLFSCEETPTATCVSRLSVYVIASIMKQLLIFGRERVLFM